jgi:hypothetical protein
MLQSQANIISHRLRDEYRVFVPYVRPLSKKALKAKALEELLFPTQSDSSFLKSIVKHPHLNHQTLVLLEIFHQSYGDIGVSALLGQIPNFDTDDSEEAPSIQTVKNILADRHYTYGQLEKLINNTLDISEEEIGAALVKLKHRDKFHENRFIQMSRKLTEYFDGKRKKKEFIVKERREAARIAKRSDVVDIEPRRTRMIKKKVSPPPPIPQEIQDEVKTET